MNTVPDAYTCCPRPPPSRQNPNGELDGRQLRFLGDAIAPYGKAGCADITTRAAIQLRGIPLDGADKIVTGLWDVGMTSLQTGRSLVVPGTRHGSVTQRFSLIFSVLMHDTTWRWYLS